MDPSSRCASSENQVSTMAIALLVARDATQSDAVVVAPVQLARRSHIVGGK